MQIDKLSKQLALRGIYEQFGVAPGSGLLHYELERLWERTGLRRNDLDDALAGALLSGELAELQSHEGTLAVLTDSGHARAHDDPNTLREIEAYVRALGALKWARARLRKGRALGRRRGDPLA